MRGRKLTAVATGTLALAFSISLGACGASAPAGSVELAGASSNAQAGANPVAVSPLPGTPDASPTTQISFLGARGTRVSGVRVSGSRSGRHSGVLRAYSTGSGESFLPRRPFAPGERVSVSAEVAPAGGAPRPARTTFAVARQAHVSHKGFALGTGDPAAVQHYITAPQITPSTVRISVPARAGAAPGDLFLAPYQGEGTPGTMIADQRGGLIWFHPLAVGQSASNFGVQRFQGKPVLVWWQGRIVQLGFGVGEDVIYDDSYRRVAVVRAGNGYSADLHEIRLTGQGTAWIDAFDPIEMDLSAVHGTSDDVLTDSVVQQIDVKTGLVMWEWHALGHLPFTESMNPVPRGGYPWDYAHLNSVFPGPAGDVLVSVRNTWAVYDLDIHSGAVRWRLGGNASSFHLAGRARFYWQHDAQFQPDGEISIFDNGSVPPKEKQSRGLVLRADPATHGVALVRQFANPSLTLLAESQGNAQPLPGGDWLLGYGRLPNFTEFDTSGRVLLDGTLGSEVENFKTLMFPWRAHPRTAPAVLARQDSGARTSVSVSWNGATEVARWRVLAGASPSALAPRATAARSGFQTTIALHERYRYVAVQGLDSADAVLGISRTVAG